MTLPNYYSVKTVFGIFGPITIRDLVDRYNAILDQKQLGRDYYLNADSVRQYLRKGNRLGHFRNLVFTKCHGSWKGTAANSFHAEVWVVTIDRVDQVFFLSTSLSIVFTRCRMDASLFLVSKTSAPVKIVPQLVQCLRQRYRERVILYLEKKRFVGPVGVSPVWVVGPVDPG